MKTDFSSIKTDTKNKVIISLDPGDHVGIIIKLKNDVILGCTLIGAKRNQYVWELLNYFKPDAVCYEIFALRASAAKKMTGNKFFVSEVIGVIKLYCFVNGLELNEIFPSSKEYCGFSDNPKDPHYKDIKIVNSETYEAFKNWECEKKITEHVRDAYRLYNYYKLFGGRFKK